MRDFKGGGQTVRKLYVAMSIAGSDSSGGAGIQADIRTMDAIGVHGTNVITALTAQNTAEIREIVSIDPGLVFAQIGAILAEFTPGAVKTGMLANASIVEAVHDALKGYGGPLVVDPVIRSSSGADLLDAEGVAALKRLLIPRATLVTPNRSELEVLGGTGITDRKSAITAGERIRSMGAAAVLITGLSFGESCITDLLISDETTEFSFEKIRDREPHGTGCMLSAAVTAHMARGTDMKEAVALSEPLVHRAIRFSHDTGRGHLLDPLLALRNEAERFSVLDEVRQCARVLERENVYDLIPEVSSNLVVLLPYSLSPGEAAGIEGRIVRTKDGICAHTPWFGVSDHVARFLLDVRDIDPEINCSMNIKLTEEIEKRCIELGLDIAHAPRDMEPKENRTREQRTMGWAAGYVMRGRKTAPDIVIDRGAFGKEPMIRVLARSSRELLKIILDIRKGLE